MPVMADHPRRPGIRFGVTDLFLLTTAAGLWLFLMMLVGPRLPLGLVPVVLSGITIAIQRLLRGTSHAWPLAAALAPMVSLACLMLAALWSSLQ
jgi:hypothetical protein